jgi:hypothetical protein
VSIFCKHIYVGMTSMHSAYSVCHPRKEERRRDVGGKRGLTAYNYENLVSRLPALAPHHTDYKPLKSDYIEKGPIY